MKKEMLKLLVKVAGNAAKRADGRASEFGMPGGGEAVAGADAQMDFRPHGGRKFISCTGDGRAEAEL